MLAETLITEGVAAYARGRGVGDNAVVLSTAQRAALETYRHGATVDVAEDVGRRYLRRALSPRATAIGGRPRRG